MSIFKMNPGLRGFSVQSGWHSKVSKIVQLGCLTLLAAFMFAGSSARGWTTNVLVNANAQTGDLTGWTPSLTGYIYVVSTNSLVPGTTNENILSISGNKNVFQLFNTTANTSYIYQDYAASSNSLWEPSCYAICYASNYFQSGANAHMEMVFFDISNNVIVSTNSTSSTAGTFGSNFLDPTTTGLSWVVKSAHGG